MPYPAEPAVAPSAPRDGRDGRQLALRLRARVPFATRFANAMRDAAPLVILAVAVIGVPVLVLEPQGLPRLRSLERDLEQVENENRAVERELTRLRVQNARLKDDLATVERVARTELGLVRKSEIVLQIPSK